jgi:hypothetical protein
MPRSTRNALISRSPVRAYTTNASPSVRSSTPPLVMNVLVPSIT